MAADPEADEKARLYRLIVQQTPKDVLLERMQLYGFWPVGEDLPPDPPAEAAERQELEAKIAALRSRKALLDEPEKALAEERKRRWEASKKRRAEAKAKRVAEAEQRRIAWNARKQQTIVHAGAGVSAGLNNTASNAAGLAAAGLPEINDAAALAAALEIDLSRLRWLTYHRRGAVLVHYHCYEIAKKSGGRRAISAPKPMLAEAQRWVLEQILAKLAIEPAANGFVAGRSILSNAAPHAGRAVVINMDLKDFFPSVTFPRIKGLFRRLGYGEQVASLLALLCTEPPRVVATVKSKRYYVAVGQRVLPQGACTSPALTNRLCRRLDRRLSGLAAKLGFRYTRYADDLSFSGDNDNKTGQLLRGVRVILGDEGFRENPAKTRIMRASRRQEVTGLVVNQRPNLRRRELRQLRAILHNAARHGLAEQNRAGHPDFSAYLRGRVAYACMADPQRAAQWRALLQQALGNPPS